MRKSIFLSVLALALLVACCPSVQKSVHDYDNSVIYEMNIRQYTQEGTLRAAEEHLPRLRDLGVDIVWLMPVHPIGVKERKGSLGSYYAIADYYGINPEFGTLEDFDSFVKKAHSLGLKVIMDCVANHTSPDAVWINECPADWYVRDSLGNTVIQYDWTDIAELNYDNPDVGVAMENMLRYWLGRGVDGFRCDMACEVPFVFWRKAIPELRKEFPGIFWLAEGENPELHKDAFDASYTWELHHILNDVAQGRKTAADIRTYVEKDAQQIPGNPLRLMFTSNHDENSWAGTEFSRMGDAVQAMALLTFTLPRSVPLIYTGQEVGNPKSFLFFEKDPMGSWEANRWTAFYRELCSLRHEYASLAASASCEWMECADANVLAFRRGDVSVVVNLGDSPTSYVPARSGNSFFSARRINAGEEIELGPWGYEVIVETPVERVEPLCWWTGMKMPLQLLVKGQNIAACDVTIEGAKGVKVSAVHKAESPDYLFVDVEISACAKPGICNLVFTRGNEIFRYPYKIRARRDGSAARESFTTADMIYLLMPDRFANGDPSNDSTSDTAEKADRGAFFGRHGGDIQGIMDHLDYIADLGATAVWTTPMLEDNDPDGSYHGYAASDYYHVDPRFGSNELYRLMVANAHEKGLKVIMDMVPNHCGRPHWWFNDRPFEDWIHEFPEYTGSNICFSANMDPNASKEDLRIHESGWFVPGMPDMNLDNPFLLKYFQQWAIWWMEFADLDGFRVDTYPYNEKEPMSRWCKAVTDEYPAMNIVGECWTSSIPQLAYWQKDNANRDGFNSQLPSIMDFPLYDAICAGVTKDNPGWGEGMTRIYDCLSHDFVYHDLSHIMIFPGNHDTDRIGDILHADPARLKIVMAMMATMRGIPQIFAGDEMMFVSKDLRQGHGGLRVDFPGGWAGDGENLFTPEGRLASTHATDGSIVPAGQNAMLHDYFSHLFNWRKGKEVIHNGKTLHFLSRDNTYGYFRYNDSDVVFVYINNSSEPHNVPWSYYSEISAGLGEGRNVVTGEIVTVSNATVVGPGEVMIVEYNR